MSLCLALEITSAARNLQGARTLKVTRNRKGQA